jgi:hypothetical protein
MIVSAFFEFFNGILPFGGKFPRDIARRRARHFPARHLE